jgi:hypothetical protein
MPTVMNAHTIAAKTDAIWLREVRVILISFVMRRTIPAMSELLHELCQFDKIHIKHDDRSFLSIRPSL